MKKQSVVTVNCKQKAIIMKLLFAATIIIMILGIYFCVISVANNISLKILNSSVHGVFLGLMVFYLGLRYYMSVVKLKAEMYKDTSIFSWNNFKKEKPRRVK